MMQSGGKRNPSPGRAGKSKRKKSASMKHKVQNPVHGNGASQPHPASPPDQPRHYPHKSLGHAVQVAQHCAAVQTTGSKYDLHPPGEPPFSIEPGSGSRDAHRDHLSALKGRREGAKRNSFQDLLGSGGLETFPSIPGRHLAGDHRKIQARGIRSSCIRALRP